MVDAEIGAAGGGVWVALVVVAVALLATAAAMVLHPALQRAGMSPRGAVGLASGWGPVIAVVLIGILAVPLGAALLALLAIILVAVMQRGDRRCVLAPR